MLKYLLLALLIVWLFYSPAIRRQLHRKPPTPQPSTPTSGEVTPVVMRQCAHCGVHFPQADGLMVEVAGHQHYFCCPEHMRAGARASQA